MFHSIRNILQDIHPGGGHTKVHHWRFCCCVYCWSICLSVSIYKTFTKLNINSLLAYLFVGHTYKRTNVWMSAYWHKFFAMQITEIRTTITTTAITIKKIIIRDWKLEVSTNLNRINFIVCSLSQIRHAIHKNFSFVVLWEDG